MRVEKATGRTVKKDKVVLPEIKIIRKHFTARGKRAYMDITYVLKKGIYRRYAIKYWTGRIVKC
jgi:hypothetical protein